MESVNQIVIDNFIYLSPPEESITTKSSRLLLNEGLKGIGITHEQYRRNILFIHIFISLILNNHSLQGFERHRISNIGLLIKSETKSTSRGDLYLYLRKVSLQEVQLPSQLSLYEKELLMSINYLIGNSPHLEDNLHPSLLLKATSKARQDINLYLASCLPRL